MRVRKWTLGAYGAVGVLLFLCAFQSLCQTGSAPSSALQQKPGSALVVHNIAGDFLTFWDATKSKPTAERVLIFKRDVAVKFPGFYGFARFNGMMTEAQRDGTIARSIESFGPIRDAYAAKLAAFDQNLSRNTSVFMEAFPDFRPKDPVWVLHSLGEFDGGTREVDGKTFLIFGVDGMVNFHDKAVRNESAFFHHELFHLYPRPRFGSCVGIWCSLWQEGLATYVASRLNPEANEAELLLTLPDNMAGATRVQMLAALMDLKGVLESQDKAVYSDLFGFGGPARTALPQRRGYYLGFLVAGELGRSYSLHALANMPAAEVQPLVARAVDQMIARAR